MFVPIWLFGLGLQTAVEVDALWGPERVRAILTDHELVESLLGEDRLAELSRSDRFRLSTTIGLVGDEALSRSPRGTGRQSRSDAFAAALLGDSWRETLPSEQDVGLVLAAGLLGPAEFPELAKRSDLVHLVASIRERRDEQAAAASSVLAGRVKYEGWLYGIDLGAKMLIFLALLAQAVSWKARETADAFRRREVPSDTGEPLPEFQEDLLASEGSGTPPASAASRIGAVDDAVAEPPRSLDSSAPESLTSDEVPAAPPEPTVDPSGEPQVGSPDNDRTRLGSPEERGAEERGPEGETPDPLPVPDSPGAPRTDEPVDQPPSPRPQKTSGLPVGNPPSTPLPHPHARWTGSPILEDAIIRQFPGLRNWKARANALDLDDRVERWFRMDASRILNLTWDRMRYRDDLLRICKELNLDVRELFTYP